MRSRTWVLTVLTVLSGLGPAARADDAPAKSADPAKPAVVKFEMLQTRHMAVQIKVNGKGPFRVIFDTGAPVTLLNNKIAKEAGMLGKNAGMPLFMGMRGQMTVKTLELGDLKAENVAVIVMDHPALTAVSQVLGPVDGIVGFPFFARYRVVLDYQKQEMTFVPVDYRPADIMADMMSMMMAPKDKRPKKALAAAALWGLGVTKADDDRAAGVTVAQVLPGSAADTAGLKAGDRLLVLDGTWTDSLDDCYRATAGVKPGETVTATVRRGDRELTISLTPRAGL